jgi:hypothetical protein
MTDYNVELLLRVEADTHEEADRLAEIVATHCKGQSVLTIGGIAGQAVVLDASVEAVAARKKT